MISDDEFEALRIDPGPIVFDGVSTDKVVDDKCGESDLVDCVVCVDNNEDELISTFTAHPVDKLWKFCDSVDSSVKLLLPDSKFVPYYLPKRRNNGEKEKQTLDREQRVFELFVQREIEQQRTKKNSQYAVPKSSILSLREERIGRDLMLEYQRDPEKLVNVINKYEKEKMERQRKVQKSRILNGPNSLALNLKEDSLRSSSRAFEEEEDSRVSEGEADDTISDFQRASTVLGKMERVLCRRATLMKEHQQEMQNAVDKWQSKVSQMSGRRKSSFVGAREVTKITPIAVIERQDKWIKILFGVQAVSNLQEVVDRIRKRKELERRRWFALRLLQRFVRRARRARRRRHLASLGINVDDDSYLLTGGTTESTIPMLRRSVAGPEELTLYHKRVESASMVVKFLKVCSKQYRSIMHCYFRKVLVIQRKTRCHLIANDGRFLLMHTFFEKIFPSFFAYLTMVLSGKGNDLKNLTSLDLSRLRIQSRHVKNHAVVEGFDAASFHAFLRENRSIFQHAGRFLGQGRNVLSTQMVNIERVKRHVLLSMVFRKRYLSATHLESVKPVTIPAQTISRNDVLAFIRGERDPVVEYLEQIKLIEENHRAEYRAKKEQSKHGRVYRKFKESELFLSIVSKITAEEYAMMVLNITEIAMMDFDRQTATPAQSVPSTANSSLANPRTAAAGGGVSALPHHYPHSSSTGQENSNNHNNNSRAVSAAASLYVTPTFGKNYSVIAMFLVRSAQDARLLQESAKKLKNETLAAAADAANNNGGGNINNNKSGEDSQELQRMIMETARRVEAEALTQQRQELVQATRRNSSMVGAFRRGSMMTAAAGSSFAMGAGHNMNNSSNVNNNNSTLNSNGIPAGISAMASAMAAAMTHHGSNSPTRMSGIMTMNANVNANSSNRPGRRLSQLKVATAGNAGDIPHRPSEGRRSIFFSSGTAGTSGGGGTPTNYGKGGRSPKAVESGFKGIVPG